MKNITILISISILLLQSSYALAQNKDSVATTSNINVTDAEGKRQGKWIITNKLMKPPLNGYAEDQKVEEGRYLDGKKTGIWTAYYPNGNMKNRITFEQGRPFGKATMYHENGKIFEEGLWRNNRWVGDYKMYYENGEVQHDFKFNSNGKRDGVQKYFSDNGQIIIEGEMHESKEVGVWKEWYENGDLKAEKAFNDGTIDVANTKTFEPKKPLTNSTTKQTEAKQLLEDAPKGKVVEVDKEKEKATVNTGNANNSAPFNGDGYAKLMRTDKQVSKDGIFKKFKLVKGKAYIYDNNGILQRIAVYDDGKYIGDAPLPND